MSSKRIYFTRLEFMEHLKAGRKKTKAEILTEAKQFLGIGLLESNNSAKKKGGENV